MRTLRARPVLPSAFSGGFFMKKLAFVALLGLAAAACTTTEERVGGAAVGAGVGAVAGPPGAIVGGAVGAVTGPSVARTTRRAVR
jgi:osmotically inducible lipoprotein OsmB